MCVRDPATQFASESSKFVVPPKGRGRRECRVRAAPAVSCADCAKKAAHEHTGQRRQSDIPCAMALRLTSCSSRWSELVVTVIPEKRQLPVNLTPASRRQNHTTWPYAPVRSSAEQKRPPHPIPTCGDDGRRPSSGMRRTPSTSDLQKCEAEYFCLRGLTRLPKIRSDLPVVLNL